MMRSRFPKFSLRRGQQRHLSVLLSPRATREPVLDGNQKPRQQMHTGKSGSPFPTLLCQCGALLEV